MFRPTIELRLIPVVELEPSDLGIESFGSLHASGEWPDYWAAKLGEWSLRPTFPGSWHVSVDQVVSQRQLDFILRAHFNGDPTCDDRSDLDEVSPLAGGLAFARADEIELEPGCCCDLADLSAWRDALERGAELFIGHGVYSLETTGGITTITVAHESAGVAPTELRFAKSDLQVALTAAETERQRFATRLEEHLRRREIPRNREIARRLVMGS